MAIQHITDQNFETDVFQNTKPVLVDYWAEWCPPCRAIAPHFEKLANEFQNVCFAKLNVDESPNHPAQAGVRGIPTFILYQKGEEVDRVVGADLQAIKRMLENVKIS